MQDHRNNFRSGEVTGRLRKHWYIIKKIKHIKIKKNSSYVYNVNSKSPS